MDTENLKMIQRFGPIPFCELLEGGQVASTSHSESDYMTLARDTIAFFIAKFEKVYV